MWRTLLAALSLVVSVTIAATPVAAADPPIRPLAIVDPESEARSAVAFLESVDEDDRVHVRLVSTYSVPVARRAEFERLMRIWWRMLTLNPNRRNVPSPVPGSQTLWWFDLRSFGWNFAAWNAVAQRDKAFREPWVAHETAERMRLLIAEKQPANFHVIALVDAWGLYRRTYQTVETSDYYDLLFAKQRFVAIEGDEYRDRLSNKDGVWKVVRANFYPRKFVDFPANEREWLTALLGDIKADDYDRAVKNLKARRGAVCKGSEDIRTGGSFVARNNRIAWVAPALGRIGAVFGETFDVVKTAGKRDLEENAFTDQDRDKGRVFRDGGELLFSLPAGDGEATLLINADGKRVEEVPPNIAIHTRDARDRRVRNGAMACLACHADAYGWIPLNNVIEKTSPDEIDAKFKDKNGRKDKAAAEDYDAFFLGWQDDLKGAREARKVYWSQATGTRAKGYADGLTGIQIGQQSLDWKQEYDAALGIDQMCLEAGLPEAILRVAASRSTLRRAADVARKDQVPRTIWDEDVFPELMKLSVTKKEKVAP